LGLLSPRPRPPARRPASAARSISSTVKSDGQIAGRADVDDRTRRQCCHHHPVKKSVADIKAGDYVASTGVKGTDGKIHAIEVRIFPEASRGTGEGQYPWDLMPDSIMTNTTVGKVDQAPQGPVLHVTFKGTESEYTVGPDVPVLANGPGDISLLKPGVAVFVIALKHEDGKLTSTRLYAEKDGIKPPM
jgi:hypothetical protein